MQGGGGGGGRGTYTLPPPPIIHPHFPSMSMCNCKNVHNCSNLIYVPFILFEGISKSILFKYILNFAVSNVLI